MKTFEALVRVTSNETWTVEAKDEAEARQKIEKLAEDVDTDDARRRGGRLGNHPHQTRRRLTGREETPRF